MELNNNTLLIIALLIGAYFYFQSTEGFDARAGICEANKCSGKSKCNSLICRGCPLCKK